MTVTVAIVDDHAAIRIGMREALARAEGDDIEVLFTAGSVAELLERAELPQIVLLDLKLDDGSDPRDNTEALVHAGCRVLVYSIADNLRDVRKALAGGADGLCRKSESIETTVEMILAVAQGQHVVSQEILAAIEGDAEYVAASLGPREREVLSLYAAGLEIPEIARMLYITENSVKEYLKRIRSKYAQIQRPASSKLDLYKRAVEDGIVPPVEPLAY